MKKILSVLTFAMLLISFATSTIAQRKISEGFIQMEITEISSDDPTMNSMLGFAKNMVTTMHFTKEKSLVTVNVMGGMFSTKTLTNFETSETLMLVDAMGQKYAVKTDNAESIENIGKNNSNIIIDIDKSVTETIVGIKCFKVVISNPDQPDMKMTAFCTKEITIEAKFIKQLDPALFPGFPLKFSFSFEGMNITYEATKFENSFDKNILNLSTDGYDMLTQEEIEKKMGGLGKMGF